MMFLIFTRHESRYIFKRDNRNIEAVAETDEAGCLFAGVNIEDACVVRWLVSDNSYAVPAEAGEANDDVGGEILVNLEEAPIVHNHLDGFIDVIRPIRV